MFARRFLITVSISVLMMGRNRAANISETGYDAKQEGQCKRRNGWVGDGDKVG